MLPSPFALCPIELRGANCQTSRFPCGRLGSLRQARTTATKGCERRHLGDESKRTPIGVERVLLHESRRHAPASGLVPLVPRDTPGPSYPLRETP
jgi:hypothetical protein